MRVTRLDQAPAIAFLSLTGMIDHHEQEDNKGESAHILGKETIHSCRGT